ncbi:MAG: acyl-CoA dehydrogenase family protein [Thermodesulfobacteriota bacterium]
MSEIEQEREMLRGAAKKLAEKVIAPAAEKIDQEAEFPSDIVGAMGAQGLLGIMLPEDYGGMEGDIPSLCLVAEEIAKVSGTCSWIVVIQAMGTLPLLLEGSKEQKDKYFTGIAEKNSLVAFALTEPQYGHDASSIKTAFEDKGDTFVLNGKKFFIPHGGVADFYTVFASSDPGKGSEGISAFLMDKDAPGLSFKESAEKLGMCGTPTADLIFGDCEIPKENLLGTQGKGWSIAIDVLNTIRPAIGAQAVGIAQGAIDYAAQYALDRTQFGKSISQFQGLRFMVADMATQTEAARSLLYKVAGMVGEKAENWEMYSAMAKYYASDVAMKVTTDAVQVLGGYGYIKDYPVERMMRDAKVIQIFGWSNEAQREIVAQRLFRE